MQRPPRGGRARPGEARALGPDRGGRGGLRVEQATLLTRVFPERAAAAVALAREIAGAIRERSGRGESTVLGLATGRTPVGVYDELARMHADEGLSFADVVTFNLDEFEGVAADHPSSFHRFMRRHLFDRVDVRPENVHLLPGDAGAEGAEERCAAYERQIAANGGIDLQILGLGLNGHIGFNEPGSQRDSRTRRVELHPLTRSDHEEGFYGGSPPTHALTMGVGTILEAKCIRMLAFGRAKAAIVESLLDGGNGPELPAGFLREHPDALILLDEEAAPDRLG